MIKFNEFINLLIEADAPPAGGADAGAGSPPPALGAGGPSGGDIGGGLGGSSAPSPVPAASGGGGGPPPTSMSSLGAPDLGTGGGAGATGLQTANINLKDAFYYLKKYFNKEKF